MSKKLIDFKARGEKSFQIRNKSEKTSEIIIYSPIGSSFWEDSLSAKQFSEEMKKIPDTVDEISVRINSPGGDVFDGITIYNRLKQHKAKKKVYIDGLAASIASIIALAGDEIIMGEGALYMVHLPWTFAFGNRMELENTINRLMDVEEQILGIYARKTGLPKTEIRAMLEAETWLGADDAIEKGFVDSKSEEALPIAASVFDSKWINKRPKGFKSETDFVTKEIDSLKKKIEATVARK